MKLIYQISKLALRDKLDNLPFQPGVYLMKDNKGRIIYVGKASSLKNRIRSYFQEGSFQDAKTKTLISKIFDFEVMVTDSEMEALILESNLIKEHKPRYNVNLKDDKRYPYIKVTTNELFPRVLIVRRVKKDKAKYFGPYTNVKAMRNTLKILRRIFPIRSCNYALPSKRKIRLCLDYHIKRCLGPCVDLISQREYTEIIKDVSSFLSGKSSSLEKHLKEKMDKLAEEENFEAAARTRDQLEALKSVTQKQKVQTLDQVDRDIIAWAKEKKDISVVVLQIREGVLISRQQFYLTAQKESSDNEILSTFLKQYYLHSAIIPEQIIIPIEIEEKNVLTDWFSTKREGKVSIITPQKGEKVKLLEMALENASFLLEELLLQKEGAKAQVPEVIKLLQKDLYLSFPPRKIAAFDISNIGSSDAVGSLIYFEDGRPKKSEYRHFKIRTIQSQDDFAMMNEVVFRYFSGLIEGKKTFPDLVLIDGGKGQLSSAMESLNSLGIKNQNIIALAKRIDEVFLPGKSDSLMISKSSPSLRLLQRIRNEAHRFAISYHRKLRTKKTIASELDQIEGVGEKRRRILLQKFGSVESVKKASLEEISSAEGINKKVAETVFNYFHKES